MEQNLILLSDFCEKSHTEIDFILQLESEGLIETIIYGDAKHLLLEQLGEIEMFSRLHNELSVNIEGIDIINNLLRKMRTMEQELNILRRRFDSNLFLENDFFDEI